MELNNNDAAVCADSIDAQGTSNAGEIDLYAELNAFAELSPEEQLRLVNRLEKPSADNVEEHPLPEPVLTRTPLELVESEDAEASAAFADDAAEDTLPEWILTRSPIEPGEPATARDAQSASDSEVANATAETSEVRSLPVEGPRPSGPLSGFNLPPEIVYTGALSRGVCLACGAESSADDLFCITCGIFIDEIESTLPSTPACADCKQRIQTDEIFCPWCGSVATA